MTTFHEAIKEIFNDIEKFLVETIKKEKLSKSSTEHKQLLLDKINKVREDYPALAGSKFEKEENKPKQDLEKGYSDDSTRTGGSSTAGDTEDQYSDSSIPCIAASDLKNCLIEGYLEKKQKKGNVLFGAPRLQKRWCAIMGSTMYYYESPKEKKQHGAFYLTGYDFELAPDVLDKKDSAKKDLSFQLTCASKRTYQFVAPTKEDLESWRTQIHKAASIEFNGVDEDDAGDVYEPVDDNNDNDKSEELIEEDIYEECPDVAVPEAPDETYDDTAVPEQDEVYDDCGNTVTSSTPSKPLPATPAVPARRKPPSPPPEPPSLPSSAPPAIPGRHAPHIPLPEIPKSPKEERKRILPPDQDFENKYYGKYDCTADEEHELAFKKGDMIHIISKHFDDKNWWVGKIDDKYGLVPKTYLVPAYDSHRTAA